MIFEHILTIEKKFKWTTEVNISVKIQVILFLLDTGNKEILKQNRRRFLEMDAIKLLLNPWNPFTTHIKQNLVVVKCILHLVALENKFTIKFYCKNTRVRNWLSWMTYWNRKYFFRVKTGQYLTWQYLSWRKAGWKDQLLIVRKQNVWSLQRETTQDSSCELYSYKTILIEAEK